MSSDAMITTPTSWRLARAASDAYDMPLVAFTRPHDSHPSIDHLVLLVFEAVLEVVCVSLPGYILARLGSFDVEQQKFLANLNVNIFTPCLIFTKLASQLNANKLAELAIIPVIFVIQTLVSWVVATSVARAFRLNRRASNFVTAMGVFGNSNSLPISLVLSLSQTLKGLHWDKIPGDNDDEVGARGILYLLIFQQLGQLVRWSWGYHVLLAPKDKYPEYQQERIEEGQYTDEEPERPRMNPRQETGILITGLEAEYERQRNDDQVPSSEDSYYPAGRTPIAGTSRASPADSEDEDPDYPKKTLKTDPMPNERSPLLSRSGDDILSFPRIRNADEQETPPGWKGTWAHFKQSVRRARDSVKSSAWNSLVNLHDSLPEPVRTLLRWSKLAGIKIYSFMWNFMNPPLWAMLIAVVVASVPALQSLFFEEGSFIKNSVTSAVKSSGGVAVPLILVVLGANLARNTQARDENIDMEEKEVGKKLLVASLISRMLLPTLIMAPILAIMAKYVPVSILDDPIFVIVCFLLTGAPSALQLAQICQINGVFEGVMSNVLFQSYVIWILPSTLVLVMCALEVVEWANA